MQDSSDRAAAPGRPKQGPTLSEGRSPYPASGVSVTPKAARQIRKALDQRGSGYGLRVAVKTSGCSGYAYALEFADAPAPEDLSFESEGVFVLVDAKSLPMVDGTQLDWVRDGLNEGFQFNNPNASATCGCGESFTV